MWCEMTHFCIPTIIQGLLCCYFPRLFHIMWPPQKGFLRYIFYLSSSTNNQPPYLPLFHSCDIIHWNGVFPYYCFDLLFLSPPNSHIICDHICRSCWPFPWRTLPCDAFFLQILVLEPSLQNIVFLVLPPPNYVFQNQRIYLFGSLYTVFEMLKFQDTLTGLYYSGKTPNKYDFSSS